MTDLDVDKAKATNTVASSRASTVVKPAAPVAPAVVAAPAPTPAKTPAPAATPAPAKAAAAAAAPVAAASAASATAKRSMPVPPTRAAAAAPAAAAPAKKLPQAKALWDFNGTEEDELTFKKGDLLNVLEMEDDWWTCELAGKRGTAPKNYMKLET
jgi:hypothetical protein